MGWLRQKDGERTGGCWARAFRRLSVIGEFVETEAHRLGFDQESMRQYYTWSPNWTHEEYLSEIARFEVSMGGRKNTNEKCDFFDGDWVTPSRNWRMRSRSSGGGSGICLW